MVYYGELQGDNFLWFTETEQEALEKFASSSGARSEETSLLVRVSGQPTKGTFYDYITHEYDPVTKEFIPYRPVYYCLLNKDKTIQIMTLHQPQPPLDREYTKVLRHMAEYHQKTNTPVDAFSYFR